MIKKMRIPLVFPVLLLLSAALSGQSNEMIDGFLERPYADLGTSAYLLLAASGQIGEEAAVKEALAGLAEKGWDRKLENLEEERPIRYGEFSYLLMQSYGLKGGLLYTLFPGPRYAAREAAYRGWLLGSAVPSRKLRPFEVINAVVMISEMQEGTL